MSRNPVGSTPELDDSSLAYQRSIHSNGSTNTGFVVEPVNRDIVSTTPNRGAPADDGIGATAEQPLLVYDDDCGVCTRAAMWLAKRRIVRIVGYSNADSAIIDRLPDNWEQCAHLVTNDAVFSCGEAMELAYLRTDHWGTGIPRVGRKIPGYSTLREVGYRVFANNRPLVGRLMGRR